MHGKDVNRWIGLEKVRRECMDKERWRLYCRGYPLEECSQNNTDNRDYELE